MVINEYNKIMLGGFQFEVLSTLERAKKRKFSTSDLYSLFPQASKTMIRKTLSKLAV